MPLYKSFLVIKDMRMHRSQNEAVQNDRTNDTNGQRVHAYYSGVISSKCNSDTGHKVELFVLHELC